MEKELFRDKPSFSHLTKQTLQEQHASTLSFAWHMKKRGLADTTIKSRVYNLNRLLKKGANLENPETIETLIATSNWTPSNKRMFADSYKTYTTYKKIEWTKPKITVPQKDPFLPQEEEVKQLIAGTGKRTSTLLQLLYETGARIGEATSLQWTDIDFKNKTIRINCPEKGSNSRTLNISNTLIAMLNSLPKRPDNNIFNPRTETPSETFRKQRNKLAKKLQNPRIKQIHFHTLRHLKATTEYKKTKDIMHVKYILGHKCLDTTLRYVHYTTFQEEQYTCKIATNLKEETDLIEHGFEYIHEKDGNSLYRKRK